MLRVTVAKRSNDFEMVKTFEKITIDFNKGIPHDEGTVLEISPTYQDALTKLPNAVIRIIPDPTKPSRPLAVLPEKELQEFLLKEHQAKAKPLIQEAGQLLPIPVNVPGGVAGLAAEYTSPGE